MISLGDHLAFWVFTFIFGAFLTLATAISIFIGSRRPNPIKDSVYECGQTPFGRLHNFRIGGATRYFVYAVIFFALDAFAWVVLTASMVFIGLSTPLLLSSTSVKIMVLYVLIVLAGIAYFLPFLKKLVR